MAMGNSLGVTPHFPPLPSPRQPAETAFSVSMDLTILDTLFKWNHLWRLYCAEAGTLLIIKHFTCSISGICHVCLFHVLPRWH